MQWTTGRRRVLCLLSCLILIGHIARAADWPVYRANNARTATTSEKLEFPLTLVWKYVPAQQHQPAWPDPFLMRGRGKNFDAAPQPVMVGDVVFFGSTTDNTPWALDASTGKTKWGFTTGQSALRRPSPTAGAAAPRRALFSSRSLRSGPTNKRKT